MSFQPGKSGNPAGKKPGAFNSKTQEREDWRARNTSKVLKTFEDALAGKTIGEKRWAAAVELRKAVLPDLRPIDADTGNSDERVILVCADAETFAALQSKRGDTDAIGE